jgi:regulator of replication initiation timing
MKTKLMKKNVAALVLATVVTVPIFGNDITDGSIPCRDVANNEEAYGCQLEDEQASNRKYKCLKALGAFDVPMISESNNFSNPKKIKKSGKMVAVGKQDGSIVFGDEDKDFKVTKEKVKEAIDAKYGAAAAMKEKFKVTFQTLKGKITLMFKKKQGESGGSGGYDIGKWDKVQEGTESGDEALVTLGNQAHQAASQSNALENLNQSLDDKVSNFPSKVDEKIQELEDLYQDKKDQVDNNDQLTTMEKIEMKRSIDTEKEEKKGHWRRKKRNAHQMRQMALRKCLNQPNIISENVLRGNGGGAPGIQRSIASGQR